MSQCDIYIFDWVDSLEIIKEEEEAKSNDARVPYLNLIWNHWVLEEEEDEEKEKQEKVDQMRL